MAIGRGTIRIRMGNHMQTMIDALYVLGMGGNLLSIIALDRKGFEVRFGNLCVRIINIFIGETIVRSCVRNGLY